MGMMARQSRQHNYKRHRGDPNKMKFGQQRGANWSKEKYLRGIVETRRQGRRLWSAPTLSERSAFADSVQTHEVVLSGCLVILLFTMFAFLKRRVARKTI